LEHDHLHQHKASCKKHNAMMIRCDSQSADGDLESIVSPMN
jgi:hypothetical protein